MDNVKRLQKVLNSSEFISSQTMVPTTKKGNSSKGCPSKRNTLTPSPEDRKRKGIARKREKEKEKAKKDKIPQPIDQRNIISQNARRHKILTTKNISTDTNRTTRHGEQSVLEEDDHQSSDDGAEDFGQERDRIMTRDEEEGNSGEDEDDRSEEERRVGQTLVRKTKKAHALPVTNMNENELCQTSPDDSVTKIQNSLKDSRLPNLIKGAVRSVLFKSIKFITNDDQWIRAVDRVLDCVEGVNQGYSQKHLHLEYKHMILDTLNLKRSSCEQAMTKIVMGKKNTNLLDYEIKQKHNLTQKL